MEGDIIFQTINKYSSYDTTEYDPEKLALMKHSAQAKLMILLHGIFCVGVVCGLSYFYLAHHQAKLFHLANANTFQLFI